MRVAENACGYLITVFGLNYATHNLGLSAGIGLLGVMLASVVGLLVTPLYGALSDRVGRRPVYLFGAGLHVVFAFPFFVILQTGSPVLIVVAFVIGKAIANGALMATQPAFFSELFGARVRYSGISLGYQFAAIFAGGLAPSIATALVVLTGGTPWLVAGYWMALGLVTLVTTLCVKETRPTQPS